MCGGARVGVDVSALLRPCVEQVLAAVFGPKDEAGAPWRPEDDIARTETRGAGGDGYMRLHLPEQGLEVDRPPPCEQTETDICVVLPGKVEHYHSNPPGFNACLVRLKLCVDILCEISASRFRLSVTEVAAAVWQQACSLWTGMDECHLTRCLADTQKSKHKETLEAISGEAREMLECVRSAGRMTSVLLPLIVEAGAGFCA